MAISSDASYSTPSRTIYWKVELFLNGNNAEPVEITRDNYLITCDLLEEATSGDTLFDNVSSNEITIQLSSPQGLFNPNNTSSIYYGKMRRNVKVIPYTRTSEEDDWKQLGEFYISEWTAEITGQTANIVAEDVLYGVFGNAPMEYRPEEERSVSLFWNDILSYFNVPGIIDSSLVSILPFAYVHDDNKKLFTQLCSAFLTVCNVNHAGRIQIRNVMRPQVLRATLTDADQVIDIDADISITNLYDTSKLNWSMPRISAVEELASDSKVVLPPGNSILVFDWDKFPLWRFINVEIASEQILPELLSISCSNRQGNITLKNPHASDTITATITFWGKYIEGISQLLGEDSDNSLEVTSRYVQTQEQADIIYSLMERYTSNVLPILNVTTRGNPNLEIGDKIRVIHQHNGVDFTGILLRQKFRYDGGLSCEMTLLNSVLVEVIT